MPETKATVPSLATLLDAIADPVRLEMLRRLSLSAEPMRCGLLYENMSRSSASYHFSKLREAGLIEQFGEHSSKVNVLRLDRIEARYPGVLSAVLASAPTGKSASTGGLANTGELASTGESATSSPSGQPKNATASAS